MITGMRIVKVAGIIVLCLGSLSFASAERVPKKVKKPPLPTLPSGPTGPIQQVPLDLMAPVAPQVSYQNGQLTIVAPNSTLGDILRAVRKQLGAEIEVPDAKERVVTHLGPAPAAEVMAELLNGSRFNYVLLGSPDDAHVLTKVVLVAKSGPENAGSNAGLNNQLAAGQQQAAMAQAQPVDQQEMPPDANDAETAEEQPADDNADQSAAEAEQPVAPPDQPGVKTPQQLLQEMQQRQLQMQQQQPGQPPIPGPVQRQPEQ